MSNIKTDNSMALVNALEEVERLQSELEKAEGRIESQHNQLLEIHRVVAAISEVEVAPADYTETLTVRRVKEMAMLINQMSGWLAESKARVARLEEAIPWTIYGDNLTATVLRKQAEAVESVANKGREMMNGNYIHFTDMYEAAQRLRQQADELENGS